MRILGALLTVLVVFLILGNTVPVLWPMITGTSENITAMAGTDSGTTIIKMFWPVSILITGLGLAVTLVMYGIRKFKGEED